MRQVINDFDSLSDDDKLICIMNKACQHVSVLKAIITTMLLHAWNIVHGMACRRASRHMHTQVLDCQEYAPSRHMHTQMLDCQEYAPPQA